MKNAEIKNILFAPAHQHGLEARATLEQHMSLTFSYAYFLENAEWKPADAQLRANAYEVTGVTPVTGDLKLELPSQILRVKSTR